MSEKLEGSGEQHEMSEGARILHELERSGEYVFHGSPQGDIVELEPRQATTLIDDVNQKDGAPGVASTPYVDLAIFHALAKYGQGNTSFGQKNNGEIKMEASQKWLDTVKGNGYVYVFPKAQFKPRHGAEKDFEWRSETHQTPVQVVAVTERDLPPDIKILE